MSRSILIVGANGFVGTALANRLLADGHTVHRLQRTLSDSAGPRDLVYQGGLENVELLRGILPNCDIVFHLASATTPGSSMNHPAMEGANNLLPTLGLIEVMHDFPGTRLVYISSGGTLYGNPTMSAVDETAPLSTLSYYGAGKLANEAFLRAFHHLNGRGVTVLRPSNLYGPEQPLRNGFGLIRTMLEHVRCGSTMCIWGDGEAVRDFLFIDDMVEACCKVLKNGDDVWQVFNVGAGTGHSINQIRKVVEEVTGASLSVVYHPPRPGDVRRIVLDCSKLHSEFGWSPSVLLANGIERTWRWLEKQPL